MLKNVENKKNGQVRWNLNVAGDIDAEIRRLAGESGRTLTSELDRVLRQALSLEEEKSDATPVR